MAWIPLRDGTQLHVLEQGRGRPVILLHGFGMRAVHWLPFIQPYVSRYRFIMPDFRGFGRSHHLGFNRLSAVHNYSEDLADILDYYGLQQVLLGGISMGAITALNYFREFGTKKIERYVHIDQSPQVLNDHDWQWGLFGDQHHLRLGDFKKVAQAAQAAGADKPFKQMPANIKHEFRRQAGIFFSYAMQSDSFFIPTLARAFFNIEALATQVMPMDNWQAYLHCMRSYVEQDYDMRPILPNIDIPVTVMIGLRSAMYPAEGQFYMADRLPQGRAVVFEKSGHALLYQEPVKFTRELGRFLKP